jgi:uncharacterized protein (TIGR00255 family)
MTGFARQEGGDASLTWSWEAKSVNSRSLDIRCRVPQGYESLDAAARGVAPQHLARGNLQLTLSANRAAAPLRVKVNRDILDQVVALTRELQGELEAAAPRLDGLLAIRGVIEAVEEEETAEQRQAREAAMQGDLEAVLQALAANRRAEGARLGAIVEQHLAAIAGLVEAATACAATQPDALRARLRQQLEELLGAAPALPEERLAQEAALLISKADVREELDRLVAHIAAARELLAAGGAVGRRLDFLCQELNREANTLCSKSPDVELTRIGLDLKGAIEQLREQVQNLE